MPFFVAFAEGSSLDFSQVTAVANEIVSLVGIAINMITSNPLLLLSIGIGLFFGAIRIIRSFTGA